MLLATWDAGATQQSHKDSDARNPGLAVCLRGNASRTGAGRNGRDRCTLVDKEFGCLDSNGWVFQRRCILG